VNEWLRLYDLAHAFPLFRRDDGCHGKAGRGKDYLHTVVDDVGFLLSLFFLRPLVLIRFGLVWTLGDGFFNVNCY